MFGGLSAGYEHPPPAPVSAAMPQPFPDSKPFADPQPAAGAKPVFRDKPNAVGAIFGRRRAVIGVIHSRPLPGSPDYDGETMESILAFAVAEAQRYADGGVDGLIVENHGDIPFAKPEDLGPETAACMAVMTQAVRQAVKLPVGVNVLANGAVAALAVAKASGAAFIRVNQWANAYVANEGFIEGRAGEAMRYRAWLRARDVRVFTDVHVKHGAHAITADRAIAELARDVEFFDADVAIATGQRTGDAATLDELRKIASGTSLPVVVGSGVNPDNIGDIFTVADGVIVASWLKHRRRMVEPGRSRAAARLHAGGGAGAGVSRVFVLGNASVDLSCAVPRLPARGETLMARGLSRAPGGKGLNQAVVAARAGAAVRFCAPLGADPEAAMVRDALAREPFEFAGFARGASAYRRLDAARRRRRGERDRQHRRLRGRAAACGGDGVRRGHRAGRSSADAGQSHAGCHLRGAARRADARGSRAAEPRADPLAAGRGDRIGGCRHRQRRRGGAGDRLPRSA